MKYSTYFEFDLSIEILARITSKNVLKYLMHFEIQKRQILLKSQHLCKARDPCIDKHHIFILNTQTNFKTSQVQTKAQSNSYIHKTITKDINAL